MEYKSFTEFWPYYLSEHAQPMTRFWHALGTASLLPLVLLAILHSFWWLAVYPLLAYGAAWGSHFLIEKNRPATFQYPLWSLRGDFKMFYLMLTGKLEQEISSAKAEN